MPQTNKGLALLLEGLFHGLFNGGAFPTNFYVMLLTSAAAVVADTNTASELTQIATGNGYTDGGEAKARGAVDFEAIVEDDTNDWAYVQTTDVVFTASGGPIPASGGGARYAALTDDNVTVANRLVLGGWDLVSDRTVSDGQTLALQNPEFRLQQAA